MLIVILAWVTGVSVANVPRDGSEPLVITQTYSKTDIANGPDARELKCPTGFAGVSVSTEFNYIPKAAPGVANQDDLIGSSLHTVVNGNVEYADGGGWAFRKPPTGGWSSVTLTLVCLASTLGAPVTPTAIKSVYPLANGFAGGFVGCPPGSYILGGSATFISILTPPQPGNLPPFTLGTILEQTPNVNTADPFNLSLVNGPALIWDAYGSCSGSCGLYFVGACFGVPDAVDAGKRTPVDTRPTSHSTQATVAPGAVGSVSVACPPGSIATAGGFIASNSAATRLLELRPTPIGTPYGGRTSGTYEPPLGWTATLRNDAAASNQIGVTAVCLPSATSTATVYEFYNTTLNHYFRTAVAEEATAIDNGAAGPGWQRTGLNFVAYVPGAGAGNDVCRFYNRTANTHFFTADADECAQVKLDPGWHYEELSFRIQQPVAGACPEGTIPVYRNYNNRFAFNDSNHRFTTSPTVYDQMKAQGWVGEGVVMCALG
jgi:hypothetical protein